jgi:putative transposase
MAAGKPGRVVSSAARVARVNERAHPFHSASHASLRQLCCFCRSGFSRELSFTRQFPTPLSDQPDFASRIRNSSMACMNQQVLLRKGRLSLSGHIYLVTFTTDERKPHFQAWETASMMAGLLTSPRNWKSSRLLAWVLMPDHWHGLIQLGDDDHLSDCVRLLKGATARQIKRSHPELGRIWASGFHDRALRKDEDLRVAARYLALNPVRAGLVERVGDYPYWDAIWI